MPNIRLGDVLKVKHGFGFPGSQFSDDPALPTIVTPGNFAVGGGFRETKAKTFNGDFPSEFVLEAGALVITMTDLSKAGDTLGLPARIPLSGTYLHNQRIGLVQVTDVERIDLGFLHYFLRTDGYRAHILGTASGSTVRHTSPSRIEDFVATVANVDQQRAIADVLSALDDKIDANDRELVAAEALMVALAGRSRQVTKVSALAAQSTRAIKPTEFPERVALFSLPAFDDFKLPEDAKNDSIKSSKFLLSEPCVLMSKLNPRIPRIWDIGALTETVSVASTEFAVLVPRSTSSALLWAVLSAPSVSTQLEGLVAGTSGSHQRVRPAEMLDVDVPDPRSLDDPTKDSVTALGALAQSRRLESQQLARTRDELLPLLMSGTVRVKGAEKSVEGVL